jgi:ubiquitin-conjugating enzyme E2 Q
MTDFVPGSLDQSTLRMMEPPAYATNTATNALNRELKATLKTQNSTPLHELGWYIDPEMVQNVYQWIVELHSFDPDLPLAKDMKDAGLKSVVLEIRFGKDYPMSPPFVRVIRPRFLPFMQGGGGHVTAGGALCMELLTNSGWSSVSSIESVLLQVRMAIANLEPKPARLEVRGKKNQQRDYGIGEAMEAYIRACNTHGWEVPKDFKDFANSSAGGGGK